MEFAIRAEHAVTGDNDGHGIHGVCGSHGTISMWMVNFFGNINIGASLAIRDSKNSLQRLTLERGEGSPVDGDGEGGAFAVQVFAQFFGVGCDPLLIWLKRMLQLF